MNELEFYLRRLDLRIGATADDIDRAYRKLAWKWHPDRLPLHQRERGTQRLQELNEARDWLRRHRALLIIAPRARSSRLIRCPRCSRTDFYSQNQVGQQLKCRDCGTSFRVVPRADGGLTTELAGRRSHAWAMVGAVCIAVLLLVAWWGDVHSALVGVARKAGSALEDRSTMQSGPAQLVAREVRDRTSAGTAGHRVRADIDERERRNDVRSVVPVSTSRRPNRPVEHTRVDAEVLVADRGSRGADERRTPDALRPPPVLPPLTLHERDALAPVATPPAGPGTNETVVRRPLDELTTGEMTRPAVSAAPRSERDATQSECWNAKVQSRTGGYDTCVRRRLRALAPRGKRPPDISALSLKQRKAIEAACWSAKVQKGVACIRRELDELVPRGRRRADLSALTRSERNSIEAVCWSAKVRNGTARSQACVHRQLDRLALNGRLRRDLSALTDPDSNGALESQGANWQRQAQRPRAPKPARSSTRNGSP